MNVVDLQESTVDEGEEFANLAAQADEIPEKEQPQVEDDLPEKYRGKSAKDIAKMHQEAEKLIGRHAQEVAENRKIIDEFIKAQLKQNQQPVAKQEDPEVDFFDDPKKAVRKELEQLPELQELKALKAQLKAKEALDSLSKKHPDYTDLVASEDFQEWIKASRVRTNLFMAANNEFDVDAADELFSTYKALKPVKAAKQAEAKQATDKTMKAAMVETGGTSNAATKKIYRRADLIRLMQYDPQRYEALQPEIIAAYQEGRVR